MQQSFRLSACHEEPERRAFAYSALDTEAEAVLLENGLGDGQAEAGALPARVGAGAVIPVKDTPLPAGYCETVPGKYYSYWSFPR